MLKVRGKVPDERRKEQKRVNEILRVEGIVHKYQSKNGETLAIEDVSFTVREGEFIGIVGPSGCGKSTLLSIIAGLEKSSAGAVFIDGKKVEGVSGDVGYMLQRDNLLEWRTIMKNVLLGLEIQGKINKENLGYAEELLKSYGLWEWRDKHPSQLSGGMRQRAALIRTLVIRPKILLLDEAFSALDFQTRLTVTDDVYKILKNEKMTTVMVSHDISESISMSDKIAVLTARPAKVKQIHEMRFEREGLTPLERRNDRMFGQYFNTIWKELDINEK